MNSNVQKHMLIALAVTCPLAAVSPHPPPGAVIAALNGLSGVMRLEGNIEGAITTLREAVRVMEDNKAVSQLGIQGQ